MSNSWLPVAGTAENLQTYLNTVNGVPVHSEAVTPTDQTGVPYSIDNYFPVGMAQILDPGNSAYITSGGATFMGAWFQTRVKGIQENITILTAFTIATGLSISDLTFTFTFQGSDNGTDVTVSVPVTLPAFEANRLLHATDWLSNQWEYYRVIMTPSRALVAGEAISISTRHSMLAGNKFLYPLGYKFLAASQVTTIHRAVAAAIRQDGTAVNTGASSTSDANSSTTNIPTGVGNGFVGSAYIDLETLAGFYISLLCDEVCSIYVDNSIDGVTVDRTSSFTSAASVHFAKQLTKLTRYAKIRVDNAGAGTTTTFRLQTGVVSVASNPSTGRLDEALADTAIAENTHAVIAAKGASGYGNIERGTSGGLDIGIVQHEVGTPIKSLTSARITRTTVTTTAGLILTALTNRRSITIKSDSSNTSSRVIDIGTTSAVTVGTGYELLAGESLDLELDAGQAFYAICNAASGTLSIVELADSGVSP